ncbi:hypothetical protein [Ralstonia syzygii]|uniref:Uncharacterized protein n=1 Tax=Ralstonia syzygii R24 TaxID=907261 RepID=G3A7V0_9RALS|nr:hypothetical protein [Ralstonia syzygii]CCA86586.1 conserved hypothetical protein [Ralstonia syzygii R24]
MKLIFRIRTVDEQGVEGVHVERLWVRVTAREGAVYAGRLDNQQRCTDQMAPGFPVVFEARNVIDLWQGH